VINLPCELVGAGLPAIVNIDLFVNINIVFNCFGLLSNKFRFFCAYLSEVFIEIHIYSSTVTGSDRRSDPRQLYFYALRSAQRASKV